MLKFAPKQILCPVDLSPASNAVLSWARLIAEAFGSRVEVLHADWSDPPCYFTEGQLSALDAEAVLRRQTLERDLQDLAQNVLGSGISFTVSVVEGHAVDVMLQRLRKRSPDLVCHGKSRAQWRGTPSSGFGR